jgi:adenine deaminase
MELYLILKWILGKLMGRYELDSFGSEQGAVARSSEHDSKNIGSIKDGERLDYLLKNASAPWSQ